MDNLESGSLAANKKSKKKKKHKPKKNSIKTETPDSSNCAEPSATGDHETLNNACLKQSVANQLPLATPSNSSVASLPRLVAEKGPAAAGVASEAKAPPRNSKSWLQSCRKENNLNRAVEENHSNALTENSAGTEDLDASQSSDPVEERVQTVAHKTEEVNKASVNKGTASAKKSDLVETVRSGNNLKNKQKDSKMPECVPVPVDETGQKTKAQLKAERKAAFEAQQRDQVPVPQKQKEMSKAERRAIQEAQRAKKFPQNTESKDDSKNAQPSVPSAKIETEKQSSVSPKKITIMEKKTFVGKIASGQKKARLFSHLPQYQWEEDLTADVLTISTMHPAVIRIGLQIAQGLITGGNARTVAMMLAFKQVIKDYTTPQQKELSRDLEAKLQPLIGFLNKCRPLSAGMENEVKKLKWEINHIPSIMSDAEAKKKLCEAIDNNVRFDITLAERAICLSICSKILDGDVILTYSCSSVVKGVLAGAHSAGRKFQVIVVDSRPRLEGREMVRYLLKKGIPCSYVLINAVSYVMKEVTKVIIGAHSLQANGYVMSRVGSSQIALLARASNVPVLVCCETYKFSERVHTDSFVYNELGNPNDLVTTTPPHKCSLENWKEIPSLRLLNLAYDVTPPDLVTAVITDLGMLPCTSVPVVLRVKHVAVQEQ